MDTFRLAEVVPKSKFEDRYVPRQAESDHSAEDGAVVQKMFKELEVAERECRKNADGKHFPNQARLQTANRISLPPMAFTP